MRTSLLHLGSDRNSGMRVSSDLSQGVKQEGIEPLSVLEQSRFRVLVSLAGALKDAASVALSSITSGTIESETACDCLRHIEVEAGVIRASALGSIEALLDTLQYNPSLTRNLTTKISDLALQDVQSSIRNYARQATQAGFPRIRDDEGQRKNGLSECNLLENENKVAIIRENSNMNLAKAELPDASLSSDEIYSANIFSERHSSSRGLEGGVTSRLFEVLEVMGANVSDQVRSRESLLQILHSRAIELAALINQGVALPNDAADSGENMSSSTSAPPGQFSFIFMEFTIVCWDEFPLSYPGYSHNTSH